MQCPKCKHENREGAKFCRKCGKTLEIICPKCNHHNEPDSMFCDNCGAKFDNADQIAIPKLEDMHAQLQSMIPDELAQKYMTAEQQATGENRPITALFADISGFTPLSATKSSEAMFQLVQDCFKQLVGIVARYEGSISGFRGDGLLALFGAPILHENDAERAILAGIEMRDIMHSRGLKVSIGINTAMMTVGEIQTQLHSEYTAYGTDVILAARLQQTQTANPGQILVGAGTHRLTRRAFDFEIISDLSLKGFSQTVTAYSVQHIKAHPEKLRGIEGLRAKMIGREHEFTEIKESVDQWLTGHGQIVSVIGEAGIGKSRLVSELKTYLHTTPSNTPLPPSQEGNHNPLNPPLLRGNSEFPLLRGDKGVCDNLILEGRCVSIGQPISYWPFIDILRTYFNLKEDDDPSTIAQKVTDGTKHIFPNTSDEILPFIGRLLSVRFGNELDDRLKFATPEQIRHQTLMQLRDFFRELANKQPLLLILEDLHWSDELSLDLITYLMDELTHAPLMLLCVYRPEKEQKVWKLGEQAQRKCLDRYAEITLRRLSSLEGRLLVEELLTIDDLPDSVKNTILEKSEGNPFFIEEVIRSLIEQDMVYRDNDRWRARSEIVNINVPDTIQSVLLSRVDRLQSEARYVLQCASVIGRLFKYSLLDHLTSQERDLNRYLTEFEDRELVYEERRIPELEYAFKHALTQEATYQSILERKRKDFHYHVAQGIEKLYQDRIEEYYAELAHHYSRSEDHKKAVMYLLKAGEKARKVYANETAISHFQKALNILEQNLVHKEWELQALHGLGEVYIATGKPVEAEKVFEKAIALAKEIKILPRELVRLYDRIAEAIYWQARYDEIIRYGEMGLDMLGDDTECAESVLMNTWIAVGYNNMGNSQKRWEYVHRNMKFISNLPYSAELAYPYTLVMENSAWLDRDVKKAMEWTEELEERARQHNDLSAVALAWHYQGDFLQDIGDYKGSIAKYEKSIPNFKRIGVDKYASWGHWHMGTNHLIFGQIEEAKVHVETWLSIKERMGNHREVGYANAHLGTLSMCQHNWDEAIHHYKKYAESFRIVKNPSEIANSYLSIGKAYLKKGDYQKAIQYIEDGLKEAIAVTHKYLEHDVWLASMVLEAVSCMEEVCMSMESPERFAEFCCSFRECYADILKTLPFYKWYLEPAEPSKDFSNLVFIDDFNSKQIDQSWNWVDQFGDCSYKIIIPDGLEIHSTNGRYLHRLNFSGPRLMKEISGDFAVEVCISSACDEKPQIGGLLIWKDKNNFLKLEKGTGGPSGVRVEGFIGGKWHIVGRGILPQSDNKRVHLRIEKSGNLVSNYCSIDGENWFTCGKMTLPMEDPIQVGIHAIGMIDRTIYCGEYKEGTATLFRNFRLWRK